MEKFIIQYYGYSQIMARIRTGNFSPKIELNIILQKMVNCKIAGVAFSISADFRDRVRIEWVEGLGEDLVSGRKEPNTYLEDEEYFTNISYKKVLKNICNMTRKIKTILKYEVDVEWGYDGRDIYILQARKITYPTSGNNVSHGIFKIDRLYFDTTLECENKLFECKNVYYGYTAKRSPLYHMAKDNNVKFGVGYVIYFNIMGLYANRKNLENSFDPSISEKVVIDINEQIRQNIIHTSKLFDYLVNMFIENNTKEHAVLIRQFIKGEIGCISKLIDGDVLVEYSTDGLMSMNRGLANCKELILKSDMSDFVQNNHCELTKQNVSDIVKLTKVSAKKYQKCTLEWVICGENAYFIDFSVDANVEYFQSELSNSRIIVQGNLHGPILVISNDDKLVRLSTSPGVSVGDTNKILNENPDLIEIIKRIRLMEEKPIIFVDKPYAILAFLFEYIKGFVFSQCSLLCHLSILLRENNIPAFVCNDFKKIVSEYTYVTILNGNIEGS